MPFLGHYDSPFLGHAFPGAISLSFAFPGACLSWGIMIRLSWGTPFLGQYHYHSPFLGHAFPGALWFAFPGARLSWGNIIIIRLSWGMPFLGHYDSPFLGHYQSSFQGIINRLSRASSLSGGLRRQTIGDFFQGKSHGFDVGDALGRN